MKAQTGDLPLLYLSNMDFILPGLILSVLNSRKPLTTHGIWKILYSLSAELAEVVDPGIASKVLVEECPNMPKEVLQSMLANVLRAATRQWYDSGSVCTTKILIFSAFAPLASHRC